MSWEDVAPEPGEPTYDLVGLRIFAQLVGATNMLLDELSQVRRSAGFDLDSTDQAWSRDADMLMLSAKQWTVDEKKAMAHAAEAIEQAIRALAPDADS